MGVNGETVRDHCVDAQCAIKNANVGISIALPDGGAIEGPLFELQDGGWERVLADGGITEIDVERLRGPPRTEPFFPDLPR